MRVKIRQFANVMITLSSITLNALTFINVDASNKIIEEVKVGNMPMGLYDFSTEVYRDKAYILGGRSERTGMSQENTVLIYDIKNNNWTEGSPIPETDGMWRYNSTLYKGEIYTLVENRDRKAEIIKYNIQDDKWSSEYVTDKSSFELGGVAIEAYRDKLYLLGGTMRKNALVYDLKTKTLSDIAPPLREMDAYNIVAYNNKLYLLGDFSRYTNNGLKGLIYDIDSDTWSYTSEIPVTTSSQFVLRQNDTLHILEQNGKNSELISYNITTDSWEIVKFQSAVDHLIMSNGFAKNGEIYLLGGGYMSDNYEQIYYDHIYKYQISNSSSKEDSAYDIIENIENGDFEHIKTLENLISGLVDSPEKEDLENILGNIKDNIPEIPQDKFPSLTPENTTNNIDVYIKSENMLSMTLNTNSITFENFSGVEDLEKLGAVNITINSSLPYELNAYLPKEIQNSDKSKTIDKKVLNIKESSESDYKTFALINEKLVLKDNNSAGNNIVHSIDLKLKGDLAHKADIYKTAIKFEAQQK